LGRQAALENTDQIVELLQGADMVFVTAGLGGGTGTGAAPVIAGLAKELDALTVAVVTKPFGFEGSRRMKLAEDGMANLASVVDAARQAISCPMLEDTRITGSRGILINITGSSSLGLHEVNEACSIIREAAGTEDVQVNFGVTQNEAIGDQVKVTVIATGFQ